MRTAVDRVGRGKERQVNVRFQAMTNHCPSSNELRLFGLWKSGVSGSVCGLI
jgi:hypothetical protein